MIRLRLPLIRVAIAVVERNGRVLVSRRRSDDYLGGYWEFPGGKRQAGESWEACLRRELREELDISVRVLERLKPVRFRYPDHTVHLEVFRCAMASGTPKPLECEAIRWLEPRQLQAINFLPANRSLIDWLTARTTRGA